MTTADLHVHSNFCDGKNSPEQIVLKAIEKGAKKIGILAHSYTEFDEIGSMHVDKYEAFINEVNRVKQIYADKIEVLVGIEQDSFTVTSTKGFDYVIGSVHYFVKDNEYYSVDHNEKYFVESVKVAFNGDYLEAAENYYNTLEKICELTNCDIVGHFDLVSKFNKNNKYFDENSPRYVKAWKKAADALVKKGVIFEINTGGISRGYKDTPYPPIEIYNYLKQKGARFMFSSDAHDGDNIFFEFDKWSKVYN